MTAGSGLQALSYGTLHRHVCRKVLYARAASPNCACAGVRLLATARSLEALAPQTRAHRSGACQVLSSWVRHCPPVSSTKHKANGSAGAGPDARTSQAAAASSAKLMVRRQLSARAPAQQQLFLLSEHHILPASPHPDPEHAVQRRPAQAKSAEAPGLASSHAAYASAEQLKGQLADAQQAVTDLSSRLAGAEQTAADRELIWRNLTAAADTSAAHISSQLADAQQAVTDLSRRLASAEQRAADRETIWRNLTSAADASAAENSLQLAEARHAVAVGETAMAGMQADAAQAQAAHKRQLLELRQATEQAAAAEAAQSQQAARTAAAEASAAQLRSQLAEQVVSLLLPACVRPTQRLRQQIRCQDEPSGHESAGMQAMMHHEQILRE